MNSIDYTRLFILKLKLLLQARKKWNTKQDSGMKNVSVALCAGLQLALKVSFRGNKKFTVPNVTKRNMPRVVLNVTR